MSKFRQIHPAHRPSTRRELGPVVVPPPPPPPAPSRYRLLVPLLIGLTLGWVVYQNLETRPASVSASRVRTAAVERGPIRRTIRLGGSIVSRNAAAIIAPRLRGRGARRLTLIRMAAAGSMVKKGDVVAEFDSEAQDRALENETSALLQAEMALAKRKAQHTVTAESDRQRLRKAVGDWDKAKLEARTAEVRSQIQAERLRMNVDEAAASVEQLRREVKMAGTARAAELRTYEIGRDQEAIDKRRVEINTGKMLLRTPIDGMIVMMSAARDGGSFAQVAVGDELRSGMFFMQVVDIAEMMLGATVNQVDSSYLRSGQRAEITLDAYPGEKWEGRLVSLGALATAGTGRGIRRGGGGTSYLRTIPARFRIESRDPRIIPDLSAAAEVILEEQRDALLVPRGAVWERGGEWFVFVPAGGGGGGGKFDERKVRAGGRSDTHVEIVEGLSEGDVVAVGLRPPKPPNGVRAAAAR